MLGKNNLSLKKETMNQQLAERRLHEIRHLAILLHETYCQDKGKCEWKFEDWVNLETNHHKAEFFDKAEKIYNYFGDYQGAKKFVELLETCPPASRMFFNKL